MEHFVKPKKNTDAILADIATSHWTGVKSDTDKLRLSMIQYSVLDMKEIPSSANVVKTGIYLLPQEVDYLGVKSHTVYQMTLLGPRKICTPFLFK